MSVFTDIDDKRKQLEEKIKADMTTRGENIDEHMQSIKEFLEVLPATHVENLMTKMDELEGSSQDEKLSLDTSHLQTGQDIDEVTQIRNALKEGNMSQAIELAKSLHVINE